VNRNGEMKMLFEYGFYEKEVSVLFEKHEKGELSFSDLKEKILGVVKEVEGQYESLVEQSAGEDW